MRGLQKYAIMGKLKRNNEKRGAIDKKWQCKFEDKIGRVGRDRGMRGLWK
jgi:hypothetical protein